MTDEAKRRINILSFWEKHGLKATLDVFDAKRRTLFLWKATLKKAQGDVEALKPTIQAATDPSPRDVGIFSWLTPPSQ